MQASDLYVASGTTADWLFGTYRLAAFTVELSAVDYPKDTAIASETGRNKDAVLYLLERAWCPLAVVSAAVREARCGAFDDDLEVSRGWTVDPDGTDTAPASARWARGNPSGTRVSGVTLQPTTTPSGVAAFVTGRLAGDRPSAYDLDGLTTIRSPQIQLPATTGQRLFFRWFLGHAASASSRGSPARDRRAAGRWQDRRLGADGGTDGRRGRLDARRPSRSTHGPARRSGSGSRPLTRPGRPRSTPASTTSGSRARRPEAPGEDRRR